MREIRPSAVAIYIRWSTDEQADGTSLEVQQERCELYVRSQGWGVSPELVFIDDGYSGGSLDRPALTRLRSVVASGSVDCVVTYRLDRLSRNLVDTVNLVRQEWKGRCIYRSATEGFDTSDDSPTGSLIFNILASFAEFERALIRERTYSGLLRRMKEGMYISGVVPYGYARGPGKGTLVISSRSEDGSLTGDAAIAYRLFALSSGPAPLPPRQIAIMMNHQGLPSPGGGPWYSGTVEHILKNPVYAGNVQYGRRNPSTPGGHRSSTIATQGTVPALVTPEEWEIVQRNLSLRPGAKPKGKNHVREDYLLTSIASCRCGGPIASVTDRNGNLYYRCGRKAKGAGCSADCRAFRASAVDENIGELVRQRFAGRGQKERALQMLEHDLSATQHRNELAHALTEVEHRQDKVRDDLRRLLRQARAGELSARTYEEFRADAEREMQELAARSQRLKAEMESVNHSDVTLEQYRAALAAADEWRSLEPTARKRILRLLVQHLTLFRGGHGPVEIDIEWLV